MSRLEWAQPGDRYADYCLWPYHPPAPAQGKLACASLLWNALETAGASPALVAMCERLRQGLGPFRTVWGVKLAQGRLSFEFYFYDYDRLERSVSLERVVEVLDPPAGCLVRYPGARPYFMVSIDLDDDIATGRRPLNCANVYVGNPGSAVSSGISYVLRPDGLRLGNFYFFFDARRQRGDIEAKIACSAHLDLGRIPMGSILPPDLCACQTIVVANKSAHDGVYYSRIRAETLLRFLARSGFPSGITDFVAHHLPRLDHLLFDAGMDYAVEDGRLRVLKTAYYGLL